jgi:hypothetical protein
MKGRKYNSQKEKDIKANYIPLPFVVVTIIFSCPLS